MIDGIKKTIEKYNMLENGDRVLVGLSGGADSTSLLVALCALKGYYNIELMAIHINHNLRESAKSDELFCKSLCERLGVEFISISRDINKIAKNEKKSLELAGRDVRYSEFAKFATEKSCTKIATAHNGDDCVETLILNLARGSGTAGLASIPPVRGNIIRPLIRTKRTSIEKYLNELNEKFVTDETNKQNNYNRNKIRNIIVPILAQINENYVDNFLRCIENIKEDCDFLDEQAMEYLSNMLDGKIDIPTFNKLNKAIKTRVLKSSLGSNSLEKTHIESIISLCENNMGTKEIALPNNMIGVANYDKLYFRERDATGQTNFYYEITKENTSFTLINPNFQIYFNIFDNKMDKIQKNLMTNILDYDKIGNSIVIRSRKSKDVFLPAKSGCHKSIKKFMIEKKIEKSIRHLLPVFLSDDKIFYVEGLGADDRFIPDENTKTFLSIEIKFMKME